jgi:hypothetical protein
MAKYMSICYSSVQLPSSLSFPLLLSSLSISKALDTLKTAFPDWARIGLIWLNLARIGSIWPDFPRFSLIFPDFTCNGLYVSELKMKSCFSPCLSSVKALYISKTGFPIFPDLGELGAIFPD